MKYKLLGEDDSSSDDDSPSHKLLSTIRIPSRLLAVTTVMLPFGAFVFSVFYAFHANYRAATLIFCKENHVFNYLPSLSAAIGDFSFSKKVWITCVTIHAPPRFLYAYMYSEYLKSIIYKRYWFWVRLAVSLNVVENSGLLMLSYISSKQSLPLHALSFVIFITSSILYMITMCCLLFRCRNIPSVGILELRSQRVKLRLLLIILLCSTALPYFYNRHNTYCEEGVYTIFAFLEYVVVICNMGFHLTAYWDFYDVVFRIPVRKFCSVVSYF